MIPILILSAAPAPVQTVAFTHPAPVVYYSAGVQSVLSASPNPILYVVNPAPRPVRIGQCAGGSCPK